jgi:hypothetical protein
VDRVCVLIFVDCSLHVYLFMLFMFEISRSMFRLRLLRSFSRGGKKPNDSIDL